MERNVYTSAVRAADESTTHVAMSVDCYPWIARDRRVKVKIFYRRGDYELRYAGALSIRVEDQDADRRKLHDLIEGCRKWVAINAKSVY